VKTYLIVALLMVCPEGFTLPVHAADVVSHSDLDGVKIRLPAEGRWSIATGLEGAWPAEWHHADPHSSDVSGLWTIYSGQLDLPAGRWLLRDAIRVHQAGLVECRRRWEWTGDKPLDFVTLSIRWQVNSDEARPFLPAINYYDNPAGQSIDANRIPVIGTSTGSRGFYEEHRFSMPLAAVEATRQDTLFCAALHSRPSPLRFGHYEDQWWSLGLERREDGVELALLSGAVASNRQSGVIKAKQRGFIAYPDGYLTVPPGAIIEKSCFLQLSPVAARGSGFRPAVWQSVDLFEPFHFDGFPPVDEVIRLKFLDTTTRWRDDDRFAGIDAFPDTNGQTRDWIDLGWAGQSEAAAFPLIVLGLQMGVEHPLPMAQRSLDFISTAPFDSDGFAIRYDYDAHEWLARRNPLSQAQAMNNILNALRVARPNDSVDSGTWEAFLRRACDFHAARVLSDDWHPQSTNEGFLMAPLAQAASLLDTPRYLDAARKAADHYLHRHLTMDEPYWGGTLDARCEDKEGAWAALQGFLALHEATRETKYLDAASHAADVVVSYVYVWDVPLPAGRLSDHALRTRGWTAVSVQNMHLDVYGVVCAPALWRLGELTGRTEYQNMARLMFVSCGQLVDATGGQGEQLHQTNYAQHYDVQDLKGVRGDYIESWNVYWISAHFLTAAAQFEELGVNWSRW
jgi:hypothetical protein